MRTPTIIEHDSPEEVDGAYAYYDSRKDEIHILKPEPLYQRILDHELNHARHRWLIRAFLNLTDSSISKAVSGFLIVGMGLVVITAGLLAGFSIFLPYGFLFLVGLIFCIPCQLLLGIGLNNLEEFFAERVARAKSRQPKNPEKEIPGKISRTLDTDWTSENP